MTEVRVGRRYARALFHSAREQGSIDEVEQDLMSLRTVWEENPGLVKLLENPDLNLGEKKQFLDRVFPEGLCELARRFMDFLLEKKRIECLVEAVSEFHELAEEERGRCEAEVTTTTSLTDSQRRKLIEHLKQVMGKEICLVEKLDPEVIGGIRVRVGDRVIDRTIRSQLVHLRENLLAARLLGS